MLNFTRANFQESSETANFWNFFQELLFLHRLFIDLLAKAFGHVIAVSNTAWGLIGAAKPSVALIQIPDKESVSKAAKALEAPERSTLTSTILLFYLNG